ncbi:MAG: HD-GYP domain-containing protein [Holophagales bacterium]|nr:HD-GYP domain-containing protein [Holophagales bacterium]
MTERGTRTTTGRRASDVERQLAVEAAARGAEEILRAYEATLEGWIRALDLRDGETQGHSRRVVDLSVRLAAELGVCGEQLVHVRRGALLHDVGKMALPDGILLKAGELDEEEQAQMRRHPEHAWEMLKRIDFLRPALDIPYCHHERWDGTGYPRGLRGEEIPLVARLFAVVDVWDALRFDRAYRAGWPSERVKTHLAEGAGTQFDPQVVPVFLRILERDGEPVFADYPNGR